MVAQTRGPGANFPTTPRPTAPAPAQTRATVKVATIALAPLPLLQSTRRVVARAVAVAGPRTRTTTTGRRTRPTLRARSPLRSPSQKLGVAPTVVATVAPCRRLPPRRSSALARDDAAGRRSASSTRLAALTTWTMLATTRRTLTRRTATTTTTTTTTTSTSAQHGLSWKTTMTALGTALAPSGGRSRRSVTHLVEPTLS
mmetsp:Transcript_1157/g.3568  ORF Transcript_1157/g.3568 Transcript_1157/m.3568 type:complete len:200 (-) Transcript_1157:416-1015(-)